MLRDAVEKKLKEIEQPHLGVKLDGLNEDQLNVFSSYLSKKLLEEERKALKQSASSEILEPVEEAASASSQWTPLGIERLTQSKVACIILAGGVGSRLNTSYPKALFPMGNTTLLEVLINKISLAREFHKAKIPCALLVSEDNYTSIANYIKEKKWSDFITLIKQEEAPLMDDDRNWVLRNDGTLATAPDGNGSLFQLLQKVGLLSQWKKRGIEDLTIVPIDNPLADPVDPILIGYHASQRADVTIKVIYRQNKDEKVGVIVRKKGRIEVCEYMELPSDKLIQSRFANIGLYALSLDFAEKISHETFPFHAIRKEDPKTKRVLWKFERFIFDMLSFSDKTNLLQYPREDVFAPLKSMENLQSVQAAIDRLIQ